MKKTLAILALVALAGMARAAAPADLAKRQCRSVHLGYNIPEAAAAYLEIDVKNSAPGTYFCALGFHMGYFGMQQLTDGKRIAIFSVWDSGPEKNRPDDVAADHKVVLVKSGEGVRAGRFGGEGTGGQSFLDLPWKEGDPARFLVQAKLDGVFTEYTAYVSEGRGKPWHMMATFRTRTNGVGLKGLYSFIEDFHRNYESAGQLRRASYLNGWVCGKDGMTVPLLDAKFTGDNTPSDAVDAGPVAGGFFLQTGGATKMTTTKLWQAMHRNALGTAPAELTHPPRLPAIPAVKAPSETSPPRSPL